MDRRQFLKGGLCLAFVPLTIVSGLAKLYPEKYITSCDQCRRDYECCKKMDRVIYPKELEVTKRFLKKGQKLNLVYRKPDNFYVVKAPCPLQLEDGRCGMYEFRPYICRIYYCKDFGFTQEELREINLKHLKEWNFGAKVKLDSLPEL